MIKVYEDLNLDIFFLISGLFFGLLKEFFLEFWSIFACFFLQIFSIGLFDFEIGFWDFFSLLKDFFLEFWAFLGLFISDYRIFNIGFLDFFGIFRVFKKDFRFFFADFREVARRFYEYLGISKTHLQLLGALLITVGHVLYQQMCPLINLQIVTTSDSDQELQRPQVRHLSQIFSEVCFRASRQRG